MGDTNHLVIDAPREWMITDRRSRTRFYSCRE